MTLSTSTFLPSSLPLFWMNTHRAIVLSWFYLSCWFGGKKLHRCDAWQHGSHFHAHNQFYPRRMERCVSWTTIKIRSHHHRKTCLHGRATRKSRGLGGRGFAGSSNSNSKKKAIDGSEQSSKSSSKRGRGTNKISSELLDLNTERKSENYESLNIEAYRSDSVELDKWGLPKVPTLEDVFPPLPKGTELIPVIDNHGSPPSTTTTFLQDVENCLVDHIDLQLGSFFDENGVEKEKTTTGKDITATERLPMKLRLLHRSPPVLSVDNFLTDAECDYIKSVAEQASDDNDIDKDRIQMVDSATFKGAISTRTSTSWFCRYQELPVFLAKASSVFNLQLQCMEEPQIVRYEPGQEFSYHYDEVPPPQLDNGGQRLATLLVYLNSVPPEAGGGTTFRDLTSASINCEGKKEIVPLVMQPKKGSALLFFPSFKNGQPDDRTLHKSHVMKQWQHQDRQDRSDGGAVDSMLSGNTKWIIQMWTHQHQYDAVLPAGNSNVAARPAMEEAKRRLGYNIRREAEKQESTK